MSSGDTKTYLESIPSRWLLTAGRNEVVADGSPNDNSPFVEAILFHLRSNQDERLRVSDLCNYVIEDVGNNARQVPRGAPLYGVGDHGGEFMFRLKEVADKIYTNNLVAEFTGFRPGKADFDEKTQVLETIQKVEIEPPIRTLGDLQKKLKSLIAADEFKKAFEILRNAMKEDAPVANTLVSLQGQFNGIRKQQNQGTVSDDFAMRTFNRIRVALTDISNKLEFDDLNNGFLQPTPNNNIGTVTGNLSELERQGLENQINILQKRLNFLLEQHAILIDPSQKFTLQMQIEETRTQIEEAKSKLKSI